MPVLSDWKLELSADDVLRAQGADPAVIRQRSPALIEIAEEALILGSALLQPVVAYEVFDIEGVLHNKLKLSGRRTLKSPLVAEHLRTAEKVVVSAFTVGAELERHANALMNSEYSLGLALNSFGSAAVDALGTALHERIDQQFEAQGVHTAVPISPGLEGWPTRDGQEQLAKLIDFHSVGIDLHDSGTLFPLKSSTLVFGAGADVTQDGTICDFCAIGDQCGYRSEFETAH